ncbi:MAG: hypothetical protein ACI9U2_004191 [Bradymonadia bacterium]|jgi:hypothetical protein
MDIRVTVGRLALGLCRLALIAMTLIGMTVGLSGCGDVDAEPGQINNALGARDYRDLIQIQPRAHTQATAAEIAQSKIERTHDACGPCRSRACRMLCILGEDYERAPERPQSENDDCLMCGRETGFLPRPRLQHEVIGVDTVVLRWDPVDGATRYVLTGVRWQDADILTSAESWEWQTIEHTQAVTLEVDNGYTFSLIAYSADNEQRSLPSVPVDIDL